MGYSQKKVKSNKHNALKIKKYIDLLLSGYKKANSMEEN